MQPANQPVAARPPEPPQPERSLKIEFITEISRNDIVVGRCSLSSPNEGTIEFRELAETRKQEFIASNRRKRRLIAKNLRQEVAHGGRFLRKVDSRWEARTLGVPEDKEAWVVANPELVLGQVRQWLIPEDPEASGISPNDVLLGRGFSSNEGNVKFRELIELRKQEYASASAGKRDLIARQVHQEIVDRRSGRFLERVDTKKNARELGIPHNKDAWVVADDSSVLQKIKNFFRPRDRFRRPQDRKRSLDDDVSDEESSSMRSFSSKGELRSGAEDPKRLKRAEEHKVYSPPWPVTPLPRQSPHWPCFAPEAAAAGSSCDLGVGARVSSGHVWSDLRDLQWTSNEQLYFEPTYVWPDLHDHPRASSEQHCRGQTGTLLPSVQAALDKLDEIRREREKEKQLRENVSPQPSPEMEGQQMVQIISQLEEERDAVHSRIPDQGLMQRQQMLQNIRQLEEERDAVHMRIQAQKAILATQFLESSNHHQALAYRADFSEAQRSHQQPYEESSHLGELLRAQQLVAGPLTAEYDYCNLRPRER